MNDYKLIIQSNPDKSFGKPCVRESRTAVSDVLSWLASGTTNDEIIDNFPELNNEDIIACISFAADYRTKKF